MAEWLQSQIDECAARGILEDAVSVAVRRMQHHGREDVVEWAEKMARELIEAAMRDSASTAAEV